MSRRTAPYLNHSIFSFRVLHNLRRHYATVTGDEALTEGDDANTVPGAATARDWMLYLPKPEPLADIVRNAAKTNAHLSSDEPPDTATEAKSSEPAINREAIRRLRGDTR